MSRPLRTVIFSLLLPLSANAAQAAQSTAEGASGSISGQVTIGGKGAVGMVVSILPSGAHSPNGRAANVTTGEEGRFRLTGVAAGRYFVTPHAPALAVPREERYDLPGKIITIADGETVEGVDFALTPGGVIAGRLVTAGGQPVIKRWVELVSIDERGRKRELFRDANSSFMYETDDRGVYRIFGVPPGRYLVCIWAFRRWFFHPGVTDESQARIIEVSPGSEVTNVDIRLGRAAQTYDVAGRIVQAETGQLVPYRQRGSGHNLLIFGPGNESKGEFCLRDLVPGRYEILFESDGESEFYSDPVFFEVTDRDITDLEIKVRRGASISGIVTVEGANNPDVLARLSQRYVRADVEQEEPAHSYLEAGGPIGADGRFRILGLPPGKARLSVDSQFVERAAQRERFWFLRVERDGVPQPDYSRR